LAKNTNGSVAIIDMDTRFGDVAIMMDVSVEYSIADVVRQIDQVDRDTIRDYLVRHSSGVNILPAPLHPTEWGAIHPQHIGKIIELIAQTHEYVVVDTPGAFNELVATALECADMILLVTSMDIASIKDTALALDAAHRQRFRGQGEAGNQPLHRRQQSLVLGRRARTRVRGLLAHPARHRGEQQQPAGPADHAGQAVRTRIAVDYRYGYEPGRCQA